MARFHGVFAALLALLVLAPIGARAVPQSSLPLPLPLPATMGGTGSSSGVTPQGTLPFTPVAIVNPLDPAYGAKCDGLTDDTTALNSAFSGSSIEVQLPPGRTCLVSGQLTISGSYVWIIGQGAGTTIRQTNASSNTLVFQSATASTGGVGFNNGLFNVFINESSTASASTTGVGLTITQQNGFQCGNIEIYNHLIDFLNQSSTNAQCANVTLVSGSYWTAGQTYAPGGVTSALLQVGSNPGYSGSANPFMFISNCNIQGNTPGVNSTVGYGVEVNAADGLNLSNCHVGLVHGYDLYIQAATGRSIIDTNFSNVFWDNSATNILIDQSQSGAGAINSINFVGNLIRNAGFASTNVRDAVTINEPTANVSFRSSQFFGNGGLCVDVADSSTVALIGNEFTQCGNASASSVGAVSITPTTNSTNAAYIVESNSYYGNSHGPALTINGANAKYLAYGCNFSWNNSSNYAISNLGSTAVEQALCSDASSRVVNGLPDSTTVGGNARGANAVDLQSARANANQVASGGSSFVFPGANNKTSASFSAAGGYGSTAGAIDSFAFGNGATTGGAYSAAFGAGANDIGVMGVRAFGSGSNSTGGDANVWDVVFRGKTTGGTAVTVTSDATAQRAIGSGNGGNCLNLVSNSVYDVDICVSMTDATTRGNIYTWREQGILYMNASQVPQWSATGSATTNTIGSQTGWAVSVSADTSPTCMTLTATPPANTDSYDVTAHISALTNQ